MKTLEDILTDYCGCFGPALNDKDEKFTTSGMEAYEYLKGFISSLGELNVLQSDEVIQKLDRIARKYIPNKLSDAEKSDAAKILKLTRGKKMRIYESWNGSSMTIIVENVEIFTKSVLFSGTNSYWGGKSGIYVDTEYLDELLSKGCSTKHNTIERCDVTTSWTIK